MKNNYRIERNVGGFENYVEELFTDEKQELNLNNIQEYEGTAITKEKVIIKVMY